MRPGCCRTHGLTDWALVGVYVRKSKSYTIDEVITVDHLPGNPNQTLIAVLQKRTSTVQSDLLQSRSDDTYEELSIPADISAKRRRTLDEMGGGEQMLLCKSLETGRITEYWENITQQHQWPHTRLASYPVPSLVVNELGTESKTTSSRLQESIKCVLNLMDTNPVGVTTNPDSPIYDSAFLGENGLDIASPDTILLQPSHKNRAAYHQKDRRTRTAQLESDRNLTNSLLSSTFREHRHTLCRLKETLTNYYLENCVQEIATVPSSSGVGTTTSNLHISGIAFTDTIPTSTTIATELGGLFVNDSIMANSLNQLQAATGAQQQLTYHWNFLFFVIIFIIAGGLGNILVCLAIALDRKLQNVTNYFLLSLAIADLLVSLFVMPLGAIPTFLGKTH